MNLKENCIKSTVKYKGRILTLTVDDVSLPNGGKGVREIVRHSGGAAVLFINNGKVALVKQHRYAYGKDMYEIPAGKMEEGEDSCVSAVRELEEETGYRANNVSHLLDIYPSPGYTDEIIHIYFTEDADYIGANPDEDEFILCEFIPLEEVVKLIESGEICDAKTVSAIYKYLATSK